MKKKLKRILPFLCATLLLFGSSMTVFAQYDDYPYPSDYSSLGYDVIVYCDEFGMRLYSFKVPIFVALSDDQLVLYDDGGVKMYDNLGQVYLDTSNDTIDGYTSSYVFSPYGSKYKILYSSFDIKYFNSDVVFFKAPPTPIIKKSVETLQPMIQKQAKTITTIAICCLALVIGLLVLPTKLRRFL